MWSPETAVCEARACAVTLTLGTHITRKKNCRATLPNPRLEPEPSSGGLAARELTPSLSVWGPRALFPTVATRIFNYFLSCLAF